VSAIPSNAERSALQWLIGQGAVDEAYSFSLERYYQRRGTPWYRCEAASSSMIKKLEKKGYIKAHLITRAGKRAAQ
jgi:hypothetical protein